jgi:Ca2+-binding RTX toxin-like protein
LLRLIFSLNDIKKQNINLEVKMTGCNPTNNCGNKRYGTPCDDNIITGSANDFINSYGGNDTIRSGSGDDDIISMCGNNKIMSGSGNDRIRTGDGDDCISAGSGNDRIEAGLGDNFVDGGSGCDTLYLEGNQDDWCAGADDMGDYFEHTNGDRTYHKGIESVKYTDEECGC